jgi:branched-chain amino acid transport system substrate-binding protein
VIAALVAATALALGVATPTDPAGESFLRGAQAYFAYANGNGGIRGRPVELSLDADPSSVLATFGPGGELAPLTPPPRAEGETYGRWLAATLPDAKVAVLYSADVPGRALLAGLRRAAEVQVVATVRLDSAAPDAGAALGGLQASGATVLCLLAPAHAADLYGALAQLRWRPQVVAASSSAYPPAGTVSAAWLSPDAPLYRKLAGRNADPPYLAGLAAAFTAVDVLRQAGASPTRASVLKAARELNEANNPFLLPGIKVQPSSRTVRVALARWTAGRWQRFGGLVFARA